MQPERFVRTMCVAEALDAHPEAAAVFRRLGYRCVDHDDWCVVIEKDSLERAADLHGKPADELVAALNALPPAPMPADGPDPAARGGNDTPPPAETKS